MLRPSAIVTGQSSGSQKGSFRKGSTAVMSNLSFSLKDVLVSGEKPKPKDTSSGVFRGVMRRFAIVVGIDGITDRGIRIEHGSIDALRVAAFFKTCGFNVKCLTNAGATKKALTDEVNKLVIDSREGDVYMVFFSGMGAKDGQGHRCWLLSNASLNDTTTYFRHKEVLQLLDKCRASQIVVMTSAMNVEVVCADVCSASSERMFGYASIEILRPHLVMRLPVSNLVSLYLMQGLFGDSDLAPSGEITVEGMYTYLADRCDLDVEGMAREFGPLFKYDTKKGEGLTPSVSVRVVVWIPEDLFEAVSNNAAHELVQDLTREIPDTMKSLMRPTVSASRRKKIRFVFILQQAYESKIPSSTDSVVASAVTSDSEDEYGVDFGRASSLAFARRLQEKERFVVKALINNVIQYCGGAELERFVFNGTSGALALQFTCNPGGGPGVALKDIVSSVPTDFAVTFKYVVDVVAEMVPKSLYTLDTQLRRNVWSSKDNQALLGKHIPISVTLTGSSHPTERVAQAAPVTKSKEHASEADNISRFHNVNDWLRPTKEDFVTELDQVFLCSNNTTTCVQVGYAAETPFPYVEQLSETCSVEYEQCTFRIVKAGASDHSSGVEDRSAIHFGQHVRLVHVFSNRCLAVQDDSGLLEYDLGSTQPKLTLINALNPNATEEQHSSFTFATTFALKTRFKLREDGEPVRFGDAVTFSHVELGKVISLGTNLLRFMEPQKYYPLMTFDETVTTPGWVILMAKKNEVKEVKGKTDTLEQALVQGSSVQAIYSGSVVTIFHKELEGFLTASYVPNGSETLFFDCSKRGGEVTMNDSLFTKYGSNSLWVVESEKPYIGGQVEWVHLNKLYRLRHFATGMYLSCESRVNEDNEREFELVLTKEFLKPSTLIGFHCILQGHDSESGLTDMKLARWEFPKVQVWLHYGATLVGGHDLEPGQQHHRIALSSIPVYESVFQIHPVSMEQRMQLYHIKHLAFMFSKYVSLDFGSEARKRNMPGGASQHSGLFMQVVTDMKRVLEALIRWVTPEATVPNPILTRNNQLLLISQNIHLLVFKCLQAPLRYCTVRDLPDHKAIVEVVHLGLKLIRHMIRNSQDLAIRLVSFVPFIETLLPYKLHAEETLVELYKDNQTLQQRVAESTLRSYMQPIPFLSLLGATCLCKDSGVTKNQNIIAHLLAEYDQKSYILFPRLLYRSRLMIRHHHGRRDLLSNIPQCVIRSPTDQPFDDAGDGDTAIQRWETHPIRNGVASSPISSPSKDKASKMRRESEIDGGGDLFKTFRMKTLDEADVARQNKAAHSAEASGPELPRWFTLEEFVAVADYECIRHFENGLLLIAKICHGGNASTRVMLQRSVSFEEVLCGIETEHTRDMGDCIRTAYVEVALHVIVGEKPYDPLLDPNSTLLSSMAADVEKNTSRLTALLKQRPQTMREDFIRKFKASLATILAQNTKQDDKKIWRNILISTCVAAVRTLVRLGYYGKSELIGLLPTLLKVLDPSSDSFSGETGFKTPAHRVLRAKRAPAANFHVLKGLFLGFAKIKKDTKGAAKSVIAHDEKGKSKPREVLQTKQELVMLLSKLADQHFSFSTYKSDVFQTAQMKEIMFVVEKDGRSKYVQGQEAFIHILKRTTMYRGSYELYHYSVRLLIRSMGTVDYQNVADNERAIDELSALVRTELQSENSGFAVNLFRQFSEGNDDYDLSIALLKVFTRVLQCEDEAEKAAMQLRLDHLGLTPLVCVLAESMQDNVSLCALECGIGLLDGGNKQIQNSLMTYFMSRSDEALFMAFSKRFRLATRQVHSHHLKEEVPDRTRRRFHMAAEVPISYEANNFYNMKQVLRFLQLFCEGHNSRLQHYLREQPDNVHTYNLVKETMSFTRVLLSIQKTNDFILDIILQAFNSLTEYCQGPAWENQLTLVHAHIGTEVTKIFDNNYPDCDQSAVDTVRSASITTLLSLLEGCTDRRIPTMLYETVRLSVLQRELLKIVQTTKLEDKEEHEDALGLGFNIFIFVKTLESYFQGEMLAFVRNLPGVAFFTSLTGRIEILREGNIERVYFRIPAICSNLSDESKEHILWNVNRDTPTLRIADFFARAEEVIYEIEYVEKCKRAPRIETVMDIFRRAKCSNTMSIALIDSSELFSRAFFHFTLFANFLLLVGTSSDPSVTERQSLLEGILLEEGFGLVLTCVSMLMAFIAVLQSIIIIQAKAPIGEFRKMKALARAQSRKKQPQSQATSQPNGSPAQPQPPPVTTKQSNHQEIVGTTWSHFKFAITLREFHDLMGIIVCCQLAAFVTPFFLPFPLLSMAARSDVLLNVIRSVTQNGKSLMMTVMLGMIITYFFSIGGFLLFRDQFQMDEDKEMQCDTLLHCFVFISTHGIRQGGGVGDVMQDVEWTHRHHNLRVMYDLVFFVLVIVILMNIIFGIIIDTFAELRSKKQKIEDDIHTRCFICGLESSAFDRNADGFEHHIRNDHNMWWYIYFIHYLQKKEISEFTGQESFVYDMIKGNDLSFFPLSRALCLDGHTGGDEDDATAYVQKLGTKLEGMEQRITELFELVSSEALDVRVGVSENIGNLHKDVRDLMDGLTAAKVIKK